MTSAAAIPPTAPIDAALALGVHARHGMQQSMRHLLHSAPLLGKPVRRLLRLVTDSAVAASFKWRSVVGVGRDRQLDRSSARIHSQLPGAAPLAARDLSTRRDRDGAPQMPPVLPIGTQAHSLPAASREFTVTPSLVWFARWHEVRLQQIVRDRSFPVFASTVARRAAERVQAAVRGTDTLLHAASPPHSNEPAVPPVRPAVRSSEPTATQPHHRAARTTSMPANGRTTANAAGERARITPVWHREAPAEPHASNHPADGPRMAAATAPVLTMLVPAAGVVTHAAARAIAVMHEVLPQRVAELVRKDVKQAVERLDDVRAAPAPPPALQADDRFAAAVLERMRALLREERFRHGELR